jgi:hypothetical protein
MGEGMHGEHYTDKENLIKRCNTERYLPTNVLREEIVE